MSKPLAGRIALITGASRGIGYATAMELATRGAHVIATARSADGLHDLEAAAKAAGLNVQGVTLDMHDTKGLERLGAEIDRAHGRLDIAIGNAAVPGPTATVEKVDPVVWDDVIAVNLTANFHLIRIMHPLLMKSDAGRVVFMSSSAVRQNRPVRGVYAVSKAGLENLVRAYAEAYFDSPLRANLFNPGPIRTAMRATVAPHEDPMKLDTPENCAKKLVDLCEPGFTETGRLYDYPLRGYMEFAKPSVPAWDSRK